MLKVKKGETRNKQRPRRRATAPLPYSILSPLSSHYASPLDIPAPSSLTFLTSASPMCGAQMTWQNALRSDPVLARSDGCSSELAGSYLALLVRLPVETSFGLKTSQPTTSECVSVQANGMSDILRNTRFLRSVAANHAPARMMRGWLAEALPKEHVIWLVSQVIVWISVRVDEEVRLGLVKADCRGEELQMTVGDIGEGLALV